MRLEEKKKNFSEIFFFFNPNWIFWVSFRVICLSLTLPDGEGNGTPLQYSCLENPMDGGTW